MKSAVCTFFEGNYHYGVAALVNSLHTQGFRGVVYVGYKGKLPFWSAAAKEGYGWQGSRILEFADGLAIHFLPLDTDYHISNYKPNFMRRIWDGLGEDVDAMFYFDPDIFVTTPWSAFEDWTACGVALCEDVNSPVARNHPMRVAWRQYFKKTGFLLQFKEAIYANAGFVGVSKENRGFIDTWHDIQEAMAPAIGGLSSSAFTGASSLPFAPFGNIDQDALNATVEAWADGDISFVGQEGMAFNNSASLMSHAIGKGKPWTLNFLTESMKGYTPRTSDRNYWQFANGAIITQPASLVKRKQLAIKIASLIGRFYRRK